MKLTKEALYPILLYSAPFKYNEQITLTPVSMQHIIQFNAYAQSIMVRKDSRFPDKKIIKMNYWEFILYTAMHPEFGVQYEMPELQVYYLYLIYLFRLTCPNHEVTFDEDEGYIIINGCYITPDILDDLRRIIIIQNDLDFDIDEFLNYDTEQRLKKAQKDQLKTQDRSTIEDYIDSLCVAAHMTEQYVKSMSIRKFWRWVKRLNLHETYTIMKTGECSGMVTYKEPVKHWMISIDDEDPYGSLKADENALKNKINGANA